MTPAQLEALSRMRGALAPASVIVTVLLEEPGYENRRWLDNLLAHVRIITEAAADLTTETVRAQLSASLATGAE